MATFNETGSGGVLFAGSITLQVLQRCAVFGEMIEVKNEERYRRAMKTALSENRRVAAFLPNIVHCRQPQLRAKIMNKTFITRE
jgi:hypothetical protein|tara:strand:- start:394 stop:645 length:252 start_codon:yes stop_codon:yes gene_type:complete